ERRVGFRALDWPEDVESDGLALRVNGASVFARGALWTPVEDHELRPTLERVSSAGMNMLRLPGIGVYETDAFHDLCDELGILVWQDFMFANMDYPVADEGFRAAVEAEARQLLASVAGRPSLAVLCGNSEVEQQVAMLGLDPEMGRGELFGELLPSLVRESGAGVPYVPSAPCGGDLPFRPGSGVANYFGVGAYRRPLDDARRAGVRFASECLAFANVPDHDPAPKEGVPRDVGASWDFEDVRDHYLELFFGTSADELRSFDQRRYLELSRAVSGEVMAEVLGEWRRAASPCAGALILWLRDIQTGSGWGVLDHTGAPKVAYHHLRRALAPVAVWTVDEGLSGVAVHVANDAAAPLRAQLRVALYRDGEHRVEEAAETVELEPHGSLETNVERMLGHFVDASWAYRFGPPQQDVIVATLEPEGGGEPLSQAFRFPAGRPAAAEPPERLALEAVARARGDGALEVSVRSQRLAYGVRIHMTGCESDDDAFSIEPGRERTILLRPAGPPPRDPSGTVTALNMTGRVRIETQDPGGEPAR
ncbi:MAG: beta-mannosidase, partial [Thermoleophilaceae bacterium]|nr:beta-mannosidase [Thermoleophilaceae bacterium]